MSAFSYVPTGFRFHPTDEELVDYYLRKKWASKKIDLDIIKEVDLYKIEPWDLEELCRLGTEDQNEWYFFSHKDKKYPTGTRTNRATKVGFWKATGRDKAIYSKHSLVGMRKTLVYYKGRAPNGQKSDWIMHEYRLETNENAVPQEEGWVVCRVFRKKLPTTRRPGEYDSPCWFDDQAAFMPDHFDSPGGQISHPSYATSNFHPSSSFKQEHHQLQYNLNASSTSYEPFLQLPPLESPKLPTASALYGDTNNASRSSAFTQENLTMYESYYSRQISSNPVHINYGDEVVDDHITDWRELDKLVASQLSQEDASKEFGCLNNSATVFPDVAEQSNAAVNDSMRPPVLEAEYFSTISTSACQVDLWK